jgi:hypothetical protein
LIKHMYQPVGSSLCGQTCVAMLAGITLDQAIEAFGGKKGGTRTKDVVAALRKLAINCGDPPLTRFTGDNCLPDTCIVKLHIDGAKHTHWVVWHEGRFYDPSWYGDSCLNKTKNKYRQGIRHTSYLPVFLIE